MVHPQYGMWSIDYEYECEGMDSESRLHLVHPPCAILIVVRVCSLIGCDIHIYMITVPTYISTMHSHILLAAHV